MPASLKAPCQSPVQIPDTDLTGTAIARLWAKDRTALGDCGARHQALAEATTAIEALGKK